MRVGYVDPLNLITDLDLLSSNIKRSSIVRSLIYAYDLPKHMTIIQPQKATDLDFIEFHSDDYIQSIKKASSTNQEEFGLTDDCYLFEGVYEYIKAVAGTTLCAAQALKNQMFLLK